MLARRTALSGLATLACVPTVAAAPRPLVRIGTGDVTSLFYAFGSAVSRLVGRPGPGPSIDLRVQGTAGSVANLQGLSDGGFEVAMATADTLRRAMDGRGARWQGRPFTGLRMLLTALPLSLITLVRRDGGIAQLSQLAGRRVFLGEPGSGARNAAEAVLDAAGVPAERLGEIADMPLASVDLALCSRRIDAALVVDGHPNLPVRQALGTCALTVLAPDGVTIAEITRRRRDIYPSIIAAERYPQLDRDVQTVGVDALLATTGVMRDDVAARIVAGVVGNVDELQRLHLAFAGISTASLTTGCSLVPYHPGAAAWLKREDLLARGCASG